jgi:hypothetical protein
MKLALPVVRPAVPDPHRQEVSQQTMELLAQIDELLAAAGPLSVLSPGPSTAA